jgi:hypothetical protein
MIIYQFVFILFNTTFDLKIELSEFYHQFYDDKTFLDDLDKIYSYFSYELFDNSIYELFNENNLFLNKNLEYFKINFLNESNIKIILHELNLSIDKLINKINILYVELFLNLESIENFDNKLNFEEFEKKSQSSLTMYKSYENSDKLEPDYLYKYILNLSLKEKLKNNFSFINLNSVRLL